MIVSILPLTEERSESIMASVGAGMPPELIGKKLQEIREAGGVSAVELAKELGMKDATLLSHYENGRRRMPDGFFVKYINGVQAIVRRRAKAVGIL